MLDTICVFCPFFSVIGRTVHRGLIISESWVALAIFLFGRGRSADGRSISVAKIRALKKCRKPAVCFVHFYGRRPTCPSRSKNIRVLGCLDNFLGQSGPVCGRLVDPSREIWAQKNVESQLCVLSIFYVVALEQVCHEKAAC